MTIIENQFVFEYDSNVFKGIHLDVDALPEDWFDYEPEWRRAFTLTLKCNLHGEVAEAEPGRTLRICRETAEDPKLDLQKYSVVRDLSSSSQWVVSTFSKWARSYLTEYHAEVPAVKAGLDMTSTIDMFSGWKLAGAWDSLGLNVSLGTNVTTSSPVLEKV